MFNFDLKFFEKHQKGLLYIANRRYLRWLLGLSTLPKEIREKRIDKITPNSIHHFIGKQFSKKGRFKQKITAEFYTTPRFAEALEHNFSLIAYFQGLGQIKTIWKFSPMGIIGCLLIALFPKIISGFFFIGTTTPYTSSSCCAWMQCNAGGWAATRNDTTCQYQYNNTEVVYVGAIKLDYYYLARLAQTADTSGLGSGVTISAAAYYIKMSQNGSPWESGNVHIVGYTGAMDATPSNYTLASYWGATSWGYGSTANAPAGSYSDFQPLTMNQAGIDNINNTGVTKFGLRMDKDLNNVTPLGIHSFICVYGPTRTGSADDPYLSITYEAGGQTFTVNDTLSLAGTTENLRGILSSISDSIGLTGSITAIKGLISSVYDSIGLAEGWVNYRGLISDAADSIGLSEAISNLRSLYSSVSDSFSMSETIESLKVLLITVSDSIGLSGALSSVKGLYINAIDAISTSEAITALKVMLIDVSDSMGLTETIQAARAFFVDAIDTINSSDTISIIRNLIITVLSALGLAELFNITKPSDSLPTISVPIELSKANIDVTLLKAQINIEIKGSNQDINL